MSVKFLLPIISYNELLANQNPFAFLTYDSVTWVEKKLQFPFRSNDKIVRHAGIWVLVV